MDYLAIGIHELANISERRMEKLTNAEPGTLHSTYIFLFSYCFLSLAVKGTSLPPFLIKEELGGLNNGFMIAQYTAAALGKQQHPTFIPFTSVNHIQFQRTRC